MDVWSSIGFQDFWYFVDHTGSVKRTNPSVSTIEAQHPTRRGFGLEVHPQMHLGGCRAKHPEADLLCASFHILLFCEGDTPTQEIDHQEFQYMPGAVIWIRPGVVHRRVPEFSGVAVCFTSAFLGSYLEATSAGGIWYLKGNALETVCSMYALMGEEYQRYMGRCTGPHLLHDEKVLQFQLMALLGRIRVEPKVGFVHESPNFLVREFLRLSEECCGKMREIEDYARALGCSDRTLRRLCLSQVGSTPSQIINRQLISRAETLLATTDAPLSSIARTLGFFDSASFSRFFKRVSGVSPGSFRKNMVRSVARLDASVRGRQELSA